MHHLTSAYRVGLLALDTLARRAHEPNQAKYSRNPPFREDIQWLLRLSTKLGTFKHKNITSVLIYINCYTITNDFFRIKLHSTILFGRHQQCSKSFHFTRCCSRSCYVLGTFQPKSNLVSIVESIGRKVSFNVRNILLFCHKSSNSMINE